MMILVEFKNLTSQAIRAQEELPAIWYNYQVISQMLRSMPAKGMEILRVNLLLI